ncbi:hypothetical protein BHE74_00029973 [Ensete ventricosum]|nr:hypothetical protein BHE74_00029973 [Ensete ventricosum]
MLFTNQYGSNPFWHTMCQYVRMYHQLIEGGRRKRKQRKKKREEEERRKHTQNHVGSAWQVVEEEGVVSPNHIAREVLDAAARIIQPGITTDEIDEVVHQATIDAGLSMKLSAMESQMQVGVVDHPYLTTLLPLWLTMPSYPFTTPVVLALLARGGSELVPSGSSRTYQIERELRNLNGAGADPTEQELGSLNDARADPTEQELGNWNDAGANPIEQELGNLNDARADPTEHELGNLNGTRADPTEHELGNLNGARANPTEHELGNLNGARANPTEHELGNLNGTRTNLTEHELGNLNGARADPTEHKLENLNLGFCQGGELGHKSWDLAEKVNSGTHPEI